MNIALIGYGNTGREIERVAQERGHSVIHRYTSQNPVRVSLPSAVDCCIDFSTASAVEQNVRASLVSGIPIVIGTTGWHDTIDTIRTLVNEHNGSLVYGSNFSLGANIFFKIVEKAADFLNPFAEYDAAVHETHHIKKKDAPSGTALTIGNTILRHFHRKRTITISPTDKRTDELLITSSRIGSVVGEHSVRFSSPADDIILIHTAHNRKGYALGAVMAAEWIRDKKGFYTFEEMLWHRAS